MEVSADPLDVSDLWIPRPWLVRQVTRETKDTVTLEIEARDKADTESFAPGQFMMLYVFGIGEVPISISGAFCCVTADRSVS